MSDRARTRVLLVDDHPVVRSGLGLVISTQPDLELVGEAATAAEAIDLFETRMPDVSLVDLTLPDRSGIELIEILRAKSPQAKFVVLTANMGSGDIAKALHAGAQAYLFKNATSDELLTAIRTASAGGRYLSPSVGNKLDESTGRPTLSATELDVLRWIVHGHTNSQIAKELAISEETVKSRIKSILGKLGVSSRSRAVALGLKYGLVQPDDV